jgi:predicted acetyltransferase
LPEDRVPADSYFLIRKADGKILGAINIRHRLNDHLQKRGGHIGYGVAPSERRKGYAGLMLKQALVICRDQLKIDRILITCDKDNIGSNKTIIKSGGILENEARDDKDNIFCRYWIKL